jgi:16S rRNA (cytosine1402-N4)-methyltransferase
MSKYHVPVLLNAVVEGLNIDPAGTYVDVTFGGGGHSRAIFEKLTTGKLIAFDQDEDAERNVIDDERFIFIKQNFKYLKNYLKMYRATPVDGILADLGVSSHQFDVPERGFSTRYDADLDMRMDQSAKLTARSIVNTYEEFDLKVLFYKYGELNNAPKLARAIIQERDLNPIETGDQLKSILQRFTQKHKENQFHARVFQALRIEVNHELDVLENFLEQSSEVLKPGGRLAVISYHSLEDRLVKNYMKKGKFSGELEKDFFGNPIKPYNTLSSKPVIPGDEEVKGNSRARSAKLRVAEKL